MAHDVFISYSSHDKIIADAVCAKLEHRRIRCWIAPRDAMPGASYAESIIDGISTSRVVVLVFSDNANRSQHVSREIERAVSKGIPILPFRIEEVTPRKSLEFFLSSSHWLDAITPPVERHLDHLGDSVSALLDKPSEPGTRTGRVEHRVSTTGNSVVNANRRRGISPGAKSKLVFGAALVLGLIAIIAVFAPRFRARDGNGLGGDPVSPLPDSNLVVSNDSYEVDEEGSIFGQKRPVVANDENFDPTRMAVKLDGEEPPHAEFFRLNEDGTFSYRHSGDESTEDEFKYKIVDDDLGKIGEAEVHIVVKPVNDKPVANADRQIKVREGGETKGNVTDNDSDAEDNPWIVELVNDADHGELKLESDGSFIYRHDGDESPGDSFTYRLSDAGNPRLNSVATVQIEIQGRNDLPVATGGEKFDVRVGKSIEISEGDLTENDVDAERGMLAVKIVGQPKNGTISHKQKTIVYQHGGQDTSPDAFKYIVVDRDGGRSNEVAANIRVRPTTLKPIDFQGQIVHGRIPAGWKRVGQLADIDTMELADQEIFDDFVLEIEATAENVPLQGRTTVAFAFKLIGGKNNADLRVACDAYEFATGNAAWEINFPKNEKIQRLPLDLGRRKFSFKLENGTLAFKVDGVRTRGQVPYSMGVGDFDGFKAIQISVTRNCTVHSIKLRPIKKSD